MKKYLSLVLITLLFVSVVSAQTRATRNVGDFTKVAFRIPGKLYLKQGNTPKVEIEASSELLEAIETKVEGNQLVIQTPGKWNSWKWSDSEKINVYVTVKNLEGVAVSGSGELIGEGIFRAANLKLSVSGSGSMKLQVEASGEVGADVSGSGNLTVKGKSKSFNSDVSGSGRVLMDMEVDGLANFGISGSGKIEASGKAERVKTSISGSGKVLGENFQTNVCTIRISGSGNVNIAVKDELDASISGSGSVRYKGDPAKVNSHASGSGRVSKM